MSARRILETIVTEHDEGRSVTLCVVVATRGSTPQPAGAMVCVDEAANLIGTLGGGCVEAEIRRLAHQAIGNGTGRVCEFQLDSDFGHDDGMICGGTMEVALCPLPAKDGDDIFRRALQNLDTSESIIPLCVEQDGSPVEYRVRITPTPRLLIAGAGHIGRILANMAVIVGFEVHVIDDRDQYANVKRFPQPIRTHVGEIARTLSGMTIDSNTFVVIVTRGHNNDEAALRTVLGSPARYIGMIGSRRKINVIYDDLRHEGANEDAIARVQAPIGIDIGAVTTDEIAVSIVAQLVQVRRRSHNRVVEGPFPIEIQTP